MPPYLEYTMSKPQSPRSRPAAAKAGEGRDGRSFFSRPKGEARATVERSERPARASGPDGGRGGHAEPRARRDAPAGRRDDGAGASRREYGRDERQDGRREHEGHREHAGQDRREQGGGREGARAYGRNERQGDAGRREALRGQEGRREYSRDDRQDARREYAGGARQDGRREPGRDDRQQDRRGEYNYNSRDSRSQGRPEYARDDRRDGRFDGRREQGHAGRGDERHGQRAYQDGPSGQNRQGPRFDGGRDDRDFRGERDGRPGAERRDGRPGQDSRPTSGHGGPRGGQARASQPSRPRQPYAAIRIDQVQRVLGEILQWTYPADAALSHWLRGHPGLGARDRSEVAEAVYDVLRHLRRYRQYGESGVGPASRRLAILGLAATLGAQELAEGLDAAEAEWLQRVSRIDPATLPRAVRGSIPDWLDERLSAMDSPDTLIEALNRQASLDLRVNPLKAERDAMLVELQQSAGRYEPVAMPYSPWGIRMEGRPAINRWAQFENGSIEVQDEGSQLLALLVAPRRGEMIIDFCAGAGGKTLLLGALMRSTGRLYAFDVSAARLARAKPRFARSGLSNVVPVAIDSENDTRIKRLAGKAQRVLVDAPCSGIGTLRRNPDLKWRQHPEALAELGQLQERILNSAARCVAPGGRLVYATCSLLAEENEVQAERFLASHPEFERLDAAAILAGRCENLKLEGPYVQLRPDLHGTDGFFAAVFERKKAGAKTEQDAEPLALEAEGEMDDASPQAGQDAGAQTDSAAGETA